MTDSTPRTAYRTHTCGELRPADVGQTVRLAGWVHRRRDHGQLLFLDLRDHFGITQCVVTPGSAAFEVAEHVRLESVVAIGGRVAARTLSTSSRPPTSCPCSWSGRRSRPRTCACVIASSISDASASIATSCSARR